MMYLLKRPLTSPRWTTRGECWERWDWIFWKQDKPQNWYLHRSLGDKPLDLRVPCLQKKNRKRTYVKLLAWSPRNIHLNYIIYKHDGGGMKIAGAWTVHYGEFHHPKVGYGPWPKACLWLIKHLFWLSYILLEVLGICCLDFFDIYWMSLGYFFGFLWYLLDVYWISFGCLLDIVWIS